MCYSLLRHRLRQYWTRAMWTFLCVLISITTTTGIRWLPDDDILIVSIKVSLRKLILGIDKLEIVLIQIYRLFISTCYCKQHFKLETCAKTYYTCNNACTYMKVFYSSDTPTFYRHTFILPENIVIKIWKLEGFLSVTGTQLY